MKKQKYDLLNFRTKKIGNSFLVTTDQGTWLFLEQEELDALKSNRITNNVELFKKLEESGVILTENNFENIKNHFRERLSFLANGPSLHIVVITLKCNHKCIYCHASSKSLEDKGCDMEKETAEKTVDFILQSKAPKIVIEFQGGEPLLRFDIIKHIIEYARKANKKYGKEIEFNVVTNMVLMNEMKLKYFLDNDIGLCTSLDGPASVHNHNRKFIGKGDSYQYVSSWIKRLSQEYKKRGIKNRRVNALITITRDSLTHSKEIIDEYVNLGLEELHIRFLNNLGDARPAWNQISYTAEQFIKFWKDSMDYLLELNKKGVFLRERGSHIMLVKLLTHSDPNFLDMRSPCGAAIGQLAYTPNGNIYTCDEARMTGNDIFKLGNVSKDKCADVLSSRQTCSIVASSINDCHICDSCVYKPYCGICPVCNYAEQGSIIAKIPETSRCKIYMAQFNYLFEKLKQPEYKEIFMSWLKKR